MTLGYCIDVFVMWNAVPPNGPELTGADPTRKDSICDAASCGSASGAAWN